jgi:hypothetical protein
MDHEFFHGKRERAEKVNRKVKFRESAKPETAQPQNRPLALALPEAQS